LNLVLNFPFVAVYKILFGSDT